MAVFIRADLVRVDSSILDEAGEEYRIFQIDLDFDSEDGMQKVVFQTICDSDGEVVVLPFPPAAKICVIRN